MKKYLLLIAVLTIVGCQQNLLLRTDTEFAEMMKENLELGMSDYDIASFTVTNWSEETLLDVYEEQFKTFDFSLNDSSLRVELGQLNSDGVEISEVFFYPYESIDYVAFFAENPFEETAKLTLTLKTDK